MSLLDLETETDQFILMKTWLVNIKNRFTCMHTASFWGANRI